MSESKPIIEVGKAKCPHCKEEWIPRVAKPIKCPRCGKRLIKKVRRAVVNTPLPKQDQDANNNPQGENAEESQVDIGGIPL